MDFTAREPHYTWTTMREVCLSKLGGARVQVEGGRTMRVGAA